ncbi:DUF7848 domain-containing protein [Streptomyces sp. NPDC002559]
MGSRTVFRFTPHTIRHDEESGWLFELFCSTPGCGADSGPHFDQNTAQDWALSHTGRNPSHTKYRRQVNDHANVTREE